MKKNKTIEKYQINTWYYHVFAIIFSLMGIIFFYYLIELAIFVETTDNFYYYSEEFILHVNFISQIAISSILGIFVLVSLVKILPYKISYNSLDRQLHLTTRWSVSKTFDVSLLEKIIISPNYSGLFYKFTTYNPSILRNTRKKHKILHFRLPNMMSY